MKISIITPTLNSIMYLDDCYKSIFLHQNYENIEWIIVDGGSTDGTLEYLKNKKDYRIKIFNENSKHPSKAYNYGITKACGEIIGILGSDDFYTKNIFIEIINIFKEHKIKWLVGFNSIINHKNKEIRKVITKFKEYKLKNYSFKSLTRNNFIPTQSVFWTSNFMPNTINNFNIEEMIESMDYDMWLRMASNFKPYILKKKLSYFRMHENSLTTKGNFKQLNTMHLISMKYGNFNFFEKFYLKLKFILIYLLYKILRITNI